ncbi:hypothetical protein MANES_09G128550v8 [Manihot esculenta]|uniref:Uncharacterized protein n=1 Tax=Manihot esculenta TaxID=3983 RepID=A0ACB7H6Y5_MANES|nr:hypothetical protein MANES_09G128550v8 [Manihot esculenta]
MASSSSSTSSSSDFIGAESFLGSNINDTIIMEELMMRKAKPYKCICGGVKESKYGPCNILWLCWAKYLMPRKLTLKNHQYFEAHRANNDRPTLNLVYKGFKFPGTIESLELDGHHHSDNEKITIIK